MNPEKRKSFIDIARRRQKAGTGSNLEVLSRRTIKIHWINLSNVLSSIHWAVVGGVATRLYMPERMTDDLDIVILAKHAQDARQMLRMSGFVYVGELSIDGSSWKSPEGAIVDVLESDEEWLEPALSEAQSNRDEQGLPILPLPFLVLMKLRAGRPQDLADVARMLGQANDQSLERLRNLFAHYAPADCEDLESLISLGKLELG